MLSYGSITTPEKAFQTLSIMVGKKEQFEEIEKQKKIAERLKRKENE